MLEQPQQQQQHAEGSKAKHDKPVSGASVIFRIAGAVLILTCLVASLANPYRYEAHPKQSVRSKHTKTRRDTVEISVNSTRWFDPIDLVLPQFPTLQAELAVSEVVVLHFGASWCKSCTSIAKMMDQILGPKLGKGGKKRKKHHRKPISVIYVSSDNNKLQFKDYLRNRYWSKVPFHSTESGRLKKYFQVCAKKEIEKLQLERKHDLPFIVVLSGRTHKVVSRRGVHELKKLGPGVVDHWTNLVSGKTAISE